MPVNNIDRMSNSKAPEKKGPAPLETLLDDTPRPHDSQEDNTAGDARVRAYEEETATREIFDHSEKEKQGGKLRL